MKEPHLFQTGAVDWQAHPTIPGIRLKSLQSKAVSALAGVSLVEVAVDGEIVPHVHDVSYETAYLLEGSAVLTLPSGDRTLHTGDGVTVPPGTLHSLKNTGSEPCRILAVHMPPLF